MKPILLATLCAAIVVSGCATGRVNSGAVRVLPGQVTDHQAILQAAVDRAAEGAGCVCVTPGDYYIRDARGIVVPSGVRLMLYGARFLLDSNFKQDGQAFLLQDASGVTFEGGEIIGARADWDAGVNVAGIRAVGRTENLCVRGTRFRDLSSNAIGVFGQSEDECARNVVVENVDIDNCCNVYVDYLLPGKGPARDSDREDQGGVAFYYVDGWQVQGSRMTGSQSDGTHFYRSHNGTFANNLVSTSKMGGYFLEGCRNVTASGNRIIGNGSRGVTIERDSRDCLLQNNLVTESGREGLWAPEVVNVLVSGNIFRANGQKDDGQRDCEIRLDNSYGLNPQVMNTRIESNIVATRGDQTAAIFLGKGVNAVIGNNTFEGPAPQVFEQPAE